MNITLFGGVGEIGGNKILVEHKGSRIFLDFGTSLGYEANFFSEFLKPRTNTAIKDRIEIGALPKIPGIYRQDLIRPDGVENLNNDTYSRVLKKNSPYFYLDEIETCEGYMAKNNKPYLDAVFLSHAHLDHTGAIGFLHNCIDLYCSKETMLLVKAIDDVTVFKSKAIDSKTNEITFSTQRSKCPDSPKICHGDISRNCICMDDKETKKIGNLFVTHFLQDHSVPGASSYVVEAGGKKLLYTGDIRFHGTYPMTIEEYAAKVGNGINILIYDGTRIDSDIVLTEDEIRGKMAERIKKTEGLVFVDFSWKDTTRYETIKQAAKEAGRIFIINARLAYLLKQLGKYPSDDDNVKIFLKRKGSCLYSPDDYNKSKHEYGLSVDWSASVDDIHYENALIASDIKEHPEKYVMMLSYFDLGQIFDLADEDGKIPNSLFIKAQCAPFSDEMELDEERLINWLDTFDIGYDLGETPLPEGCENKECPKLRKRIDRAHVSGHASRPELKELIERIKPEILIPVHTEHQEEFIKLAKEIGTGIKVIIPEYGKPLPF